MYGAQPNHHPTIDGIVGGRPAAASTGGGPSDELQGDQHEEGLHVRLAALHRLVCHTWPTRAAGNPRDHRLLPDVPRFLPQGIDDQTEDGRHLAASQVREPGEPDGPSPGAGGVAGDPTDHRDKGIRKRGLMVGRLETGGRHLAKRSNGDPESCPVGDRLGRRPTEKRTGGDRCGAHEVHR